jgi:hypothetical protein
VRARARARLSLIAAQVPLKTQQVAADTSTVDVARHMTLGGAALLALTAVAKLLF